jgi:hypothetical protein
MAEGLHGYELTGHLGEESLEDVAARREAAARASRRAGRGENPEVGSPETNVPTSEPTPGLLSRPNPENAPVPESEPTSSFNPRVQGGSYPGNLPTPPTAPPLEFPTRPPPVPTPALGREFTSPNIKEGLVYNTAKRALRGKLHAQAKEFHGQVEEALARHLGTAPAKVQDAIGDWSDGAENSTTTAWKDQPFELRRQAAALKGLHSAQKNVIVFENRDEGPHSLYTLRFASDDAKKVRDALDQNGLQFRTIEPSASKGQGTTVHVVDTDGGARAGIENLIKGGHVEPENVEERSGHAEFLGDPEQKSREVAARNYRGILQAARDQASQGEGRAGATVPWFEGLEPHAEQSYRDLSNLPDIRGPKEAEDLRQAAIDRANLTPEEQERLNKVRGIAKQWVDEHPGSHPLSAHHFIQGHEEFPDWVNTKEDIGKFFNARNKRLDYAKAEDRQTAADALIHDVMHAINGGSDAADWYDRTVDRSLRKVSDVAPDILTNPEDEMAYKLATAVTSQNQDVFPNFESGYLAYRHWKKTGEFPTNAEIFGGGTKSPAMIKNFTKLNRLWEKHGAEGLREILETPMTMRKLRDEYGLDPKGESLDHVMEGAAMLGPKLGSFYNNLNKRFHSITFDMWNTRNMNRLAGNMFAFSPKAMRKDTAERDSHLTQLSDLLSSGGLDDLPKGERAKMTAEIKRLQKIPEAKLTREHALEVAPTIANWAERIHKVFQEGEGYARSYPPELKTPKNKLAKNYDLNLTDLEDAPRNATERGQFRDIYKLTREGLAEHGLKLRNADLQAVLWYPEQKLFQLAGSRNRGNFDYLDAAHRLVRKVRSGELPALHA